MQTLNYIFQELFKQKQMDMCTYILEKTFFKNHVSDLL